MSVDDFFQNHKTAELIEQYSSEIKLAGLPKPVPQVEAYRMLEASGMFVLLTVFDDDELIGFAHLGIPPALHYGVSVACMESLFLEANHRKGYLGLNLIKRAEQEAQSRGAVGLLVSAAAGSRLEQILPKFDYRHSNTVYFRSFA